MKIVTRSEALGASSKINGSAGMRQRSLLLACLAFGLLSLVFASFGAFNRVEARSVASANSDTDDASDEAPVERHHHFHSHRGGGGHSASSSIDVDDDDEPSGALRSGVRADKDSRYQGDSRSALVDIEGTDFELEASAGSRIDFVTDNGESEASLEFATTTEAPSTTTAPQTTSTTTTTGRPATTRTKITRDGDSRIVIKQETSSDDDDNDAAAGIAEASVKIDTGASRSDLDADDTDADDTDADDDADDDDDTDDDDD